MIHLILYFQKRKSMRKITKMYDIQLYLQYLD